MKQLSFKQKILSAYRLRLGQFRQTFCRPQITEQFDGSWSVTGVMVVGVGVDHDGRACAPDSRSPPSRSILSSDFSILHDLKTLTCHLDVERKQIIHNREANKLINTLRFSRYENYGDLARCIRSELAIASTHQEIAGRHGFIEDDWLRS